MVFDIYTVISSLMGGVIGGLIVLVALWVFTMTLPRR